MADQIPFGVVEHILIKLGSLAVREIRSMYGVPKELIRLNEKLGTIKAVLLDAEEQQHKNHAVKDWVQRLNGVVYDADDLLDDYATHYLQRGGLARQVSDFFSPSNQVAFRFKMSHRLKNIKESLDDIAKDIPLLNLIPRDTIPTRVENSWRDTHSFVLASEIVGRDENKREIVNLLVSSDREENLSVVALVGIGGLGKTTLTQLVYNDDKVVNHFEPKIWVCVSDDSGDGFDVNTLIKIFLKSMNVQDVESLQLNSLKDKLHERISQKRYLLVLDDVWNEDFEKWDKVRILLMVGAKGSKILVTTRKTRVASVMGNDSPFVLKGLEENQSWDLFSSITFREGPENVHPNFIEIGKDIAKMCKGVPLIIKTLGTMLRFKLDERHWLLIKNNENLLSLQYGNDNVLLVLKLSYDDLPIYLRQCFTYCALFPKDYQIEKNMLVQLWIAQGYVQSSSENEHLEDVGGRYFEELLSRSLLDVVQEDYSNGILTCKMHDLVHDLAQSIIGSEVLILRDEVKNILEKVHHVSFLKPLNPMIKALKEKPIRTFLMLHGRVVLKDDSIVNTLGSFKCLRALSLKASGVGVVPKCLSKLSHLRYLDLSGNDFEILPDAITKLKNLQTLKLCGCWYLKSFPKGTRELINLRHLENGSCGKLAHMPYGIGELTLLQSLPLFIVGNDKEGSRNHKIGSLTELRRLNQLRGWLEIKNLENVRDVVPVSKGEILKGKQYLQSLKLDWEWGSPEGKWDENGELVMEGLQPHPNLKELIIHCYGGRRFPSWMMNDGLGSLLPNLCNISMLHCSRCQILPPFSQLPSLKSLKLDDMEEVENVMEGSLATPFFPSLQFLTLKSMPKLKGLWWMELPGEQGPSFPCLSNLHIHQWLNFASIRLPSSPSLSKLSIDSCSNLTSLELYSSPRLSELRIRECPKLTSLDLRSSPCLSSLSIRGCRDLTSFKAASLPCLEELVLKGVENEVLRQILFVSASSLKSLYIKEIFGIRSLPEELLQHASTLRYLKIKDCYNLATLPHWIGSLISLTELTIRRAYELTSLPEEIRSLKNLRLLDIPGCSHLREICRKETGEDWPMIAYIPDFDLEADTEWLSSLEFTSSPPEMLSLKIGHYSPRYVSYF